MDCAKRPLGVTTRQRNRKKIGATQKPAAKVKYDSKDQDRENLMNIFPLLSVRLCAAIWSHITDCDETFNYWEPLHYLLYGRGLQTWEYSPQFALRSYTYLLLHGIPGWFYDTFFQPTPVLVFYFTRCLLAICCAATELFMYKAICREFGVHIGRMWIIFQLFSAGMFISSTALLPSTFSMYFTSAALTAWWTQRHKLAIFMIAISALLGWPFAIILGIPIVFDILILQKKVKMFLFWALISGVTITIPMIVIDSSYFGKLVIAPLNLIIYNVFTSHGPNLYGTEPFSYYIINGFLNFNLIWLAALATPILLFVCWLFVPAKSQPTLTLPHYISLAPFYLWLAVFMLQPHKEERFLFPIYPLITLNGAISIDVVQKIFYRIKKHIKKLPSTGQHYLDHTTFIAAIFVILTTIPNVSRIISLYRNYHAPLDLMMELPHVAGNNYNVCVGKDWFRFPTSFILPSTHYKIRFIKSEFQGLLPAYFEESENGTMIVHPYFNDLNQENEFMYFDVSKCNFLVDLDTGRYSSLEPNYAVMKEEWEIVKSLPFLNAVDSHPFFRAFYVPYLSDINVKMANFNLLKRISTKDHLTAKG